MDVDRKAACSYPVGQSPPKARIAITLAPDRRELCGGTEDDKLGELDAIRAQLAAQFVQGRLHGRCLGDRVSATVRRHEVSVAPVWIPRASVRVMPPV
jgi:hypothetical protein